MGADMCGPLEESYPVPEVHSTETLRKECRMRWIHVLAHESLPSAARFVRHLLGICGYLRWVILA